MIAIITISVILILPNLIAAHVCLSRPCRYKSHLQFSVAWRRGHDRELSVAAEPRRCTTGLQFAAALADQSVEDVVIIADITLEEADWSNFSLPIKLTRNVTVRGFDKNRDNWAILDFSFIKSKVQLGAEVALMFQFLVLYRWREDPHFMAPGLDLIAPGPVPERADGLYWPAVMTQNAALIQRSCAPVLDQLSSNGSIERPTAFPGMQTSTVNVSQAGCLSPLESPNKDDPRLLRPTRRCWPLAGLREDIVTFANYLDKTGRARRAGYLVSLRDTDYFCEKVMSENCTKEFTPVGCYWRMFPRNVSGGNIPAPPTANDAHKTPSSSSSHDIMLGGALGGAIGLCIVGLIGGVVTIVMYRRGCFHRRANPYSVKYFFGNRSSRNHGGKAGSVTDPDNSMNPIDGSDGSHSHLLTDRGKQQPIIALNLMERSSPSGPQLRRSDELPLPATNNQSVDFPTDPLSLVPVTSLTPLHPGIDLDVKLCGAELTLSEVTLGKGSFGRVVRGTYFGIPVAVKLINHGLVPSPECQKQEDLPQAALYQSTDATSVVSDTADNKNVLGGGIRVVMGGRGTHQQQCGSAEQLPSSASGNEDSHTTVCTDNTELAAAGAMKNDGVGAVTGGDVERGCDNGSMVRSNKFLYSSDEDSVTARSRKPAAAGDVKDMETAILDENSEEIDMTDQPSRIQQCTSYANDNNAQVYIARSPQMDHNERIASHVGAQKPRALGMNSVEATLKQEVEVLARCQHPNIVRLLAASLQAPRFCLVMELMELSLDRLLYGSGEPRHLLPLDMVLHIGDQIARGLAYLHPTIVHRDLKPANVLISNAGSSRPVVKLADFGLSRLRNTVLITTNPEVGTAPYVAPEVFDVHNFTITDRVDVYALGVILWEMLAGQRPWEGHNIVVVAVVVAMHHRRPPLGVLSETRCPPKLRSLIRACWDPVPRRRPAAAEVVKALALVQEALSVAQHQQHGGNVEQQ